VYALKSVNRNYIYVGLTNDLERRFQEHNAGYNRTTKPYSPFEVLWHECFETRVEARAREKYLKGGSGKKFLRALVDSAEAD
jgi:putative endonuclease